MQKVNKSEDGEDLWKLLNGLKKNKQFGGYKVKIKRAQGFKEKSRVFPLL